MGMVLGSVSQAGDVFLLVGELGSGKTCLTQGIARGLGVEGWARSPTFVLVNVYRGRVPVYHIDLYRLEDTAEVLDLGIEDYLAGDGVCIVEWADKALQVFPKDSLLVKLDTVDENVRRLHLEAAGPRSQALLAHLTEAFHQVPQSRERI